MSPVGRPGVMGRGMLSCAAREVAAGIIPIVHTPAGEA